MKEYNTVKLMKSQECATCGYPVVFMTCDDRMATTHPYSDWEWWAYCANKLCVRHSGEGLRQDRPAWIVVSK